MLTGQVRKLKPMKKFLIFIFFICIFAVTFKVNAISCSGGWLCCPNGLQAERNPIEKVYCYAEKYDGHFQTSDIEDASMNDPIFGVLEPITKRIIALENQINLTKDQVIEKLLLEKQIERIFNQRNNELKASAEQFAKIEEKERKKESQKIGWLIFGFLIALYIGITSYSYTRPKNIEKRRLRREQLEKQREIERLAQEERDRVAKIEKERERQQRELERQKEKEAQMAEYQQLRKEIEAMPKSANYKKAVFLKNGEKCEMCGNNKKEDLEIHHRKSFYSIVQKYQIKNIAEAFECDELWDVENGSVLCKKCHAKMESSKYHVLNNLAK